MKKKIAAAVLAAMALTTVSAFAAPIQISGDGYVQYNNTQQGADKYNGIDTRLRLNIDSNMDNLFNVHARIVNENDLSTSYTSSAARLDQAYLAGKIGTVNVQVGKDDLFTGKGLLIDDHNFSGLKASTNFDGVKIAGFIGKDGSGVKTRTADIGTSVNGLNLGANAVTLGNTHYYGFNADTKLGEATLSAEYVKNDTTNAKGYIAGVSVGNYTVSYRDIDAGAVTGYTTNGNYNDSKGFKLAAHYNVSKNSSVTLYQDFAKDQAGAQKHRTNIEYDFNF